MKSKATLATMIYTDGRETIYGVFQGFLHHGRRTWFDIATAQHVGSVQWQSGQPDQPEPTYREMAQRFETAEFPAYWFTKSGRSFATKKRLSGREEIPTP